MNAQVDLSTTYCGVRLKNLLISASGTQTLTVESAERHAKAGWGAIVLKTIFLDVPAMDSRKAHPSYIVADSSGRHLWRPKPPKKSDPKSVKRKAIKNTPYNLVALPFGLDQWYPPLDYADYYEGANKKCEPYGCTVIPSIYAGSEEGWDKHLKMLERTKPKMVEVNFGCPHVFMFPGTKVPPGLRPGVLPTCEPEVCERVTKYVVDRANCPVSVKFYPYDLRNIESALAVQRAGAKGIQFADTATGGQLRIDIETATPGWLPDMPTFGGIWGSWVIPHICGQICQMRKAGVTIDISGCGGITEFEDMVRYVMAGATSVQVCRAVMVEGWDIAGEWLGSLSAWMATKGYRNIKDMSGIVVDKVLTDPNKVVREDSIHVTGIAPSVQVVVDEKRCIGCTWCENACKFCAIEMVGEHPKIERGKCEVCGLCVALCPVKALSFQSAKPVRMHSGATL